MSGLTFAVMAYILAKAALVAMGACDGVDDVITATMMALVVATIGCLILAGLFAGGVL